MAQSTDMFLVEPEGFAETQQPDPATTVPDSSSSSGNPTDAGYAAPPMDPDTLIPNGT